MSLYVKHMSYYISIYIYIDIHLKFIVEFTTFGRHPSVTSVNSQKKHGVIHASDGDNL